MQFCTAYTNYRIDDAILMSARDLAIRPLQLNENGDPGFFILLL